MTQIVLKIIKTGCIDLVLIDTINNLLIYPRYKGTPSPPDHVNHTIIQRYVDNSNGYYNPVFTQETEASFIVDNDMLWSKGLDYKILEYISPSKMYEAHCDNLLGDEDLFDNLQESRFDVMLVDVVGVFKCACHHTGCVGVAMLGVVV